MAPIRSSSSSRMPLSATMARLQPLLLGSLAMSLAATAELEAQSVEPAQVATNASPIATTVQQRAAAHTQAVGRLWLQVRDGDLMGRGWARQLEQLLQHETQLAPSGMDRSLRRMQQERQRYWHAMSEQLAQATGAAAAQAHQLSATVAQMASQLELEHIGMGRGR